MRRPVVTVSLLLRACSDCGRVAYDVRMDHDGLPRCFSGVGCQGAADRAAQKAAGKR